MFFPRWPRWRSALLSPLILNVVGCATNGAGAPHAPPPPLPGTEACIFTVNLNDWTVIDNSTLIVYAPLRVGSSRVDLQACKLEYSIVSPK